LKAVRRGVRRALLVADLPYGAYHVSNEQGLANAIRFVKEGGAEAVKFEGGRNRARLVRELVEAQIPVMGHIGLTPQSIHTLGSYQVQGRTLDAANELLADAEVLEEAGAFAVVLECVPRELAAIVTRRLRIPTIGIGAGPDCDGQILVFHDLVGLSYNPLAKFVRSYANLGEVLHQALVNFRVDVAEGGFPADRESYHWSAAVREQFERETTRSA
ncbi:MAG TPA: 3-methyl-2-oxobutanoate hydroxymethyltransferase, partial [Terriglobia bacterium]|nr:3-methyl-2-oxobutanoate hydroxymethyltransferase [Terriglobia bacterium]